VFGLQPEYSSEDVEQTVGNNTIGTRWKGWNRMQNNVYVIWKQPLQLNFESRGLPREII